MDSPAPRGRVRYWLEEIGGSGPSWHGPVVVEPAGAPVPAALALEPPRPNPFAGRTTIHYRLPVAATVHLGVYDLRGRLVRTLFHGRRGPGEYAASWDGRASDGEGAGPGLFILRMRAGGEAVSRKVVVIR